MLAEFARRADFDCFLLAGRYTLLDQIGLARALAAVRREGHLRSSLVGSTTAASCRIPIPGSISGVSSDAAAIETWKDNVTFNYVPADEEIIGRAAALKTVCDRHGVPLMAAAIQFPMHHPAVAAVVTGPRSPEHVVVNNEMLRYPIPNDLWAELKQERLIFARSTRAGMTISGGER